MHVKYGLSAALIGTSIALIQSDNRVAIALTAPEVSNIAKQITVRIEYQAGGKKRQGSGFIIKQEDSKYYVLTAHHVVADDTKYTLIAPDGERYALDNQKISYKAGIDLAVVQFDSPKTYKIAKIGKSSNHTEGTIVYVVGFPAPTSTVTSSELYRFLPGQVSANASEPLAEGYSLVYTNPTVGGMSGGPVLNERAEVIGIHGKAETQAQVSGDEVKIARTGNNLGISIDTFLKLNLLKIKPEEIATNVPNVRQTPKADNFYLKGTDLAEKKDYDGAIEAYSRAIEINPQYELAYLERGNAYYYLKDYPRASADYTKAIAINPQNYTYYYNRGSTRDELEDYTGAIEDYNRAIAINPKHAYAYNNRGLVYSERQDYAKAIDDFTQALRISPDDDVAYYNRGISLYELGKVDAAIKDWRNAINLNSGFPARQLSLGIALYKTGRTYQGFRYAKEAIEFVGSPPNLQLLKRNGWGKTLLKDAAKMLDDPLFDIYAK